MNYILKPWPLGEWFYLVIKFGLVQYVCASLSFITMALQGVVKFKLTHFPVLGQMIIKSICAILAVILEALGVYCEGEFKLNCG